MLRCLLMILVCFALQGCSPSADERFDTGFSDGYAEGYNTECKIRATIVEGDWSNKDYSRGYEMGRAEGVDACKKGE